MKTFAKRILIYSMIFVLAFPFLSVCASARLAHLLLPMPTPAERMPTADTGIIKM